MPEPAGPSFGLNAGLVDEMYERFLADPRSVSDSWRDFFEDYRPETAADGNGSASTGGTRVAVAHEATDGRASVLRGADARLAANMTDSLTVPTATSARVVPARLLEVNRKVINGHLGRTGSSHVSFTHLIGYAVVRAAAESQAMRSVFVAEEGRPAVTVHDHVGLGLAVDVVRADGSRTLIVPCIRDADTLDFSRFHAAYEELVRKVRSGRLMPDDMAGVTCTLTNPGTLGTAYSVPRLMPGQSVIVAVGALGYPAEFEGSDRRVLAQLGVSKILTLTSTYDHRVIQGAESATFLGRIHDLLLGADGFYDEVFRSLGIPYESVRWRPDSNPPDDEATQRAKQAHVHALVNTYRVRGHLIADLDPLRLAGGPRSHAELDPANYGLTIWDLDREFFTDGLAGRETMTLGDLLGVLRDAYCRRVGIEYMHIQEPEQKRWIQSHVEGPASELAAELSRADKLHILDRLNAAEAFERFLHTKFVGHKRFGLEGAESAIPLIDAVLDVAAGAGCHEAVLGMAHRGRLNVLANVVGKSLSQIFREFEGDVDPASIQGSGDVKYHLGAQGTFEGREGRKLPVTLASNPSHLEAVDPVVLGMVRAKQDLLDEPDTFAVLPLLVHGDAAFAGQGVVAETLNLSALRGYRVGGTVHLVINNQLGFTTAPTEARSSVYPTDLAKMVQAPIFHVNGDDPEACVRVARLAFAFRERFRKDVVIDMVCYRRHGHNESDDPSYTQPLMYKLIGPRRSVRKLYTETLVRRGDIALEEAERALEDFTGRMQTAFIETRQSSPPAVRAEPRPLAPAVFPATGTGVERALLDRIAEELHHVPEDFTVHPKLGRHLEARLGLWRSGETDWPLAEALAFASLLREGTDVRLSGQDTRRGTFSQRHAVLVDFETGQEWMPLCTFGPGHARVFDSLLSEYAVLGFEYGYSISHPRALVAWEAQFGDFVNVAQVVVDQFIAAAADKWGQQSGVTLLLPHGYEGQGPEHSSARMERFLTLCAGDNLRVIAPTTAAQYFHALRSQVRADPRPLVIFTPKSLLRSRLSRSGAHELVDGGFQPVLDDPSPRITGQPSAVRGLVLASGKVAYDAVAVRDERSLPIAVVRVEQLAPWPEAALAEAVGRYPRAHQVTWLQEEPENMGAWTYVRARLERLVPDRVFRSAARPESASPATGSQTTHRHEQRELIETALAPS